VDLEQELAHVLREEQMRQFRENEPGTWPAGRHAYEEHQAPWLAARAALEFLRSKGLLVN
jgi:hypothetical protein